MPVQILKDGKDRKTVELEIREKHHEKINQ